MWDGTSRSWYCFWKQHIWGVGHRLHKGLYGFLPVNSTCLLDLVVARDLRLKILKDCLNI